MDIEFIQYLMPDGRPQIVRIDRPDVIARKAAEIMKLGNRFECEMLSDYATVSLTITDDQGDVDIDVVPLMVRSPLLALMDRALRKSTPHGVRPELALPEVKAAPEKLTLPAVVRLTLLRLTASNRV